jgi:hypothetical protein
MLIGVTRRLVHGWGVVFNLKKKNIDGPRPSTRAGKTKLLKQTFSPNSDEGLRILRVLWEEIKTIPKIKI